MPFRSCLPRKKTVIFHRIFSERYRITRFLSTETGKIEGEIRYYHPSSDSRGQCLKPVSSADKSLTS